MNRCVGGGGGVCVGGGGRRWKPNFIIHPLNYVNILFTLGIAVLSLEQLESGR